MQAYRKMYKGCNIVTTNVEITHLEKPGVIDFLDDIEEVIESNIRHMSLFKKYIEVIVLTIYLLALISLHMSSTSFNKV